MIGALVLLGAVLAIHAGLAVYALHHNPRYDAARKDAR